MMKFKIEKIVDEYYSDKTYVVIKLSLIDGEFRDNFKEGDKINITKAK
jgi:hypothetical protein